MCKGVLRLSADCMQCIVRRQMDCVARLSTEWQKSEYMQRVFKIIAEAPLEESAPIAFLKINELYREYFGEDYSFLAVKEKYNRMMLDREAELRDIISASADKLKTALKYARVGNYIDFGTMESVNDEKLNELLSVADEEQLDEAVYEQFRNQLRDSGKLVYLTDNCGEIVLDKLLLSVIREMKPELDITVIVRGMPVSNDATLDDAKMVGMTELFRVIGNGTPIAGTFYKAVSEETKGYLNSADMILSKGQANFETLNGCGLNVYYLFLCKCTWFSRQFDMKYLGGVFKNESRIVNL